MCHVYFDLYYVTERTTILYVFFLQIYWKIDFCSFQQIKLYICHANISSKSKSCIHFNCLYVT